jgi:hypothetical protein
MIRALQERLISIGAISSRESIVRVPCMAHVIQLCLKQLLGYTRAAPKNKEVRAFWSDTQAHGLKSSTKYGNVPHTLRKVSQDIDFFNIIRGLTALDPILCGLCQPEPTTA